MPRYVLIPVALLAFLGFAQTAEARVINVGIFFNQGGNIDVTNTSVNVVTASGITFNVNLAFTAPDAPSGSTIVDSGSDPGGQSHLLSGIAVNRGGGETGDLFIDQNDEDIEVTVTLTPISSGTSGDRFLDTTDFTFKYVDRRFAGNATDSGEITVPSGTHPWTNNSSVFYGNHNTFQTFPVNFPGESIQFEGDLSTQQNVAFDVQPGFDIPAVNSGLSGGTAFGDPVKTFRINHTGTAASSFRLDGFVVQVKATPEPSSFLLGLMVAVLGAIKFGSRWLIGRGRETGIATS